MGGKKIGTRAQQGGPPEALVTPARDARDEILRAEVGGATNPRDRRADGEIEVLKLLAAADFTETLRPTDMTTREVIASRSPSTRAAMQVPLEFVCGCNVITLTNTGSLALPIIGRRFESKQTCNARASTVAVSYFETLRVRRRAK